MIIKSDAQNRERVGHLRLHTRTLVNQPFNRTPMDRGMEHVYKDWG